MKLASKPMANPAVIFREVAPGEAVLVNTDTTASIVLNTTGITIWKLMDGNRALQDIVTEVRRQFRDVPDSVSADVRSLVDSLAEEGFVGYELLAAEG